MDSFDWSIPGPVTYGTDPDGPVIFAGLFEGGSSWGGGGGGVL